MVKNLYKSSNTEAFEFLLFENENLGNLELLCRFMTESACELLTLETQMFCSVLAKGFQLEEFK
jgi:hypothetical protein